MSSLSVRDSGAQIAPETPRRGNQKRNTIRWKGRDIPLVLHDGIWRMRSRTADFRVSFGTGTSDLAQARIRCRDYLEQNPTLSPRSRGTLEDVAALYLAAGKKTKPKVARGNVGRLRSLVETALGKPLDAVRVDVLPDLWPAYIAKRQGKDVPDYSARRSINRGINSAMRQAASIFIRRLHPHYRKAGIVLPVDAINITWLPIMDTRPEEADDKALLTAWEGLYDTDRDLWVVVGLARFAGLRQGEILACRGKWMVKQGAAVYVSLQDREADGYWTKTGRRYLALVMHPGLAEYLLSIPAEAPVIARPGPAKWLGVAPQAWLRQFTGSAKAPLHRLRGLYADHVKRETEIAMAARLAGIKAASESLGHTTTTTTERHYLTPEK